MPLGIDPADIHDGELRATMQRAAAALSEDRKRDCVEACAEA